MPITGRRARVRRVQNGSGLFRDIAHRQISHRLNSEGVRYPIEESEHSGNVNRLRDLLLRPAGGAKRIGVIPADFMCLKCDLPGKLQ